MMSIYMPVLIAWLSYTYAGGLALYFVASNLVGIAQYVALGKLDWRNLFGLKKEETLPAGKSKPAKAPAANKSTGKKSSEANFTAQAFPVSLSPLINSFRIQRPGVGKETGIACTEPSGNRLG